MTKPKMPDRMVLALGAFVTTDGFIMLDHMGTHEPLAVQIARMAIPVGGLIMTMGALLNMRHAARAKN